MVTLRNGKVTEKLIYAYKDSKSSTTALRFAPTQLELSVAPFKCIPFFLRGVCQCMEETDTNAKCDPQRNTLIPWGLPHTRQGSFLSWAILLLSLTLYEDM